MNSRVLKVIAVVWGVGLLGTYVACRSTQQHAEQAPPETAPPSNFTQKGGLQTFVGGKSAAVFHPEYSLTTQPASTQTTSTQPAPTQPAEPEPVLLPGSKSMKVRPEPLRVLPGWKSAPVDMTSPSATTQPAGSQP